MAWICAVAGVIATNKLKNNLDTFPHVLRLDELKCSFQNSKDRSDFILCSSHHSAGIRVPLADSSSLTRSTFFAVHYHIAQQ